MEQIHHKKGKEWEENLKDFTILVNNITSQFSNIK